MYLLNQAKNPLSKSNLRIIANGLTTFRAISGLPLIFALSKDYLSLAWSLFFLSSTTDLVDGWLAKKAGGGSLWGARFDPLSDKILYLAPLIWLSSIEVLPLWAIWLLMARELLITSWRGSAKNGGKASLIGKAKTSTQFLSFLFLLYPGIWGDQDFLLLINKIGLYLFWISLFFAVISAWGYIRLGSTNHRS